MRPIPIAQYLNQFGRAEPTPADRVMLGEVLLADRSSITAPQIGEHFAAALAEYARRERRFGARPA